MFIVVEHTITNPNMFFGLTPKVAQAPEGIRSLQFLPSVNSDRAICLWEGESIEAVKAFLDPLSAQCSRNTYYAVDSAKALGLPAPQRAAA